MSVLPKARHPLIALLWFVLGSAFFLLGCIGSKDMQALWITAAAMCWLGFLGSVARWLSRTAATSASPALRAIERIRSYVANEPASYEKTKEREANYP